jgi:uncharacterized LabA/DUF88 family protein
MNAFDIVKKLRQRLMVDRNMAEDTFTAYGSIRNIPVVHQTDLHNANVHVPLIADVKYGAADRQIYMDLLRFKEQRKAPTTIVLISGDIDFIKCINELRYQHRHHIIVIHNKQAKRQLLETANETYPWHEFIGKVIEPSITNAPPS